MNFERAQRLKQLPPYLFKELDRLREEVRARGVDIIDLGVGDPDNPSPPWVVSKLASAAADPATHRYPAYSGMSIFRQVAAEWFWGRFGVKLDPGQEVITLIGSKEGLAHFPLAFVNPGDVVLYPEPGYPVYHSSVVMAGGVPVGMPLLKENGFLPDFDGFPKDVLAKAKAIIVNYPNNPTAAVADRGFYSRLVEFAWEHGLIVVSDAAYSEMTFGGYRAPSFLEVYGAKEVGIEFHSLSKTFNMTGWRLGFAVGNAELVAGLGQVKSQIDSGAFDAVQLAGIAALINPRRDERMLEQNVMYQGRRDALVGGLRDLGLPVETPQATFYVWCGCPSGVSSAEFTKTLLNECGIVSTPGNGFGPSGEGYVRFALTQPVGRIHEAVERMKKL